ncbi:MAG: RNA-binding transcriptional accessory protein [Candidatus Omnitrophica bacterium]|nr:RNA-binding transcriptional accessory protein [Candidatus Omnitrophota bacterium]
MIKNIVSDLGIAKPLIENTTSLLNDGATIPFISRYRKEKTGGLDETQVRNISEKLQYYIELEKRKDTILKAIKEQGKLTDELYGQIAQCREKQKLEDLYLPYKPKKRTKATLAREKGLEPLANIILLQQVTQGSKQEIVKQYFFPAKGVATYDEAMAGALDIVAEKISDNAEVRDVLRKYVPSRGLFVSKVQKKWVKKKSKYESYYDFSEPITRSLSHRILAVRRGTKEKVLSWRIVAEQERAIQLIESEIVKNRRTLFIEELLDALKDSYKRLLFPSIENEVFLVKLEEAEKEAINVFSKNLRNLLLFPPAGHKIIIGVDPGFRTGCKIVVIDRNGSFKEYQQIFPHPPGNKKEKAEKILKRLICKYKAELIAIGNGTASRETSIFVNEVIKKHNLDIRSLIVSEAGASVYSASETAKEEFPDLDVTVRGAISIGRRLQDPLSELVKIDPKSIGVGQYQHDVNQVELKKALSFVVESCVNYVGVDLNTASVELLSYVSGIGKVAAKNIVRYFSEQGSFKDKRELLKVPRLGDKVFQQCAGFLRILGSNNPLDNSAIHPESYHIVEKMARDCGVEAQELIGNEILVTKINASRYVTGEIGLLTLNDILEELKKPGLDPRKEFTGIQFSSEINDIKDLRVDMVLEGIVTNVTNFGAFVDIGVHQDGLIHISRLSDKFVKSPHDIVSVGDTVKVKIISLDKELKRIGLERLRE